jgi:phosphoribosylanthranilate isomerase
VKVCGLTRLDDARAALQAGADWLGFVVKADSPRAIAAGDAARIVAALGEAVAVAVMVAPSPDEALSLARAMGARRVQLHRVEPGGWPVDFPLPVTFAIGVSGSGEVAAEPAAHHLLMLDTAHAVLAGGTGRTFPWEVAVRLAARRDVLLAGGLAEDNVGEAIERVRPFGVDASSRLETEPGVKDHDKLRRFVAAVRSADGRDRHLA